MHIFPVTMKVTTDQPHDGAVPSEFGLVGAETLLERLFPHERDRPSIRTLREWQRRRLIPYKKINGKLVLFDVGEVRAALDRNFTVNSR